ncbi:hypothetical protein ASG93_16820 [Paenibacillus sp. Soil787]|nr:hypothetical protein ASG93_16820 [Paenibacillus sp. Soil787]
MGLIWEEVFLFVLKLGFNVKYAQLRFPLNESMMLQKVQQFLPKSRLLPLLLHIVQQFGPKQAIS